KRRNTSIGGGNRWLRTSLLEAAWSVSHSRKPSFFTARYRRLAARRGKKRAAVAIAHSLLIAIYHVLKDGVVFQDLGPAHFEQRNRDAIVRRSLRRLEGLGYKVTVETMTARAVSNFQGNKGFRAPTLRIVATITRGGPQF